MLFYISDHEGHGRLQQTEYVQSDSLLFGHTDLPTENAFKAYKGLLQRFSFTSSSLTRSLLWKLMIQLFRCNID
jgi:hypothetical protein